MYCFKCGEAISAHHKFCSNCGTKIDLSFLQRDQGEKSEKSRLEKINYNELFRKMEATLKQ
jgi:hypothetical protein